MDKSTIEVASSEERVRARSPVASRVCRACVESVQVSVECVRVSVREGRVCVGCDKRGSVFGDSLKKQCKQWFW